MKIVFVGPLQSRFVRNDIEILQREHELVVIDAIVGRGWIAIVNLIRLQLRIILSLLKADALFFWFADYYAYIPTRVAKLLRKKVYVVAGGFDVWYMPELQIGARTRPSRWWLVKRTFQHCSKIFPVSNYADQLLRESVPNHAPSTVIYNTVDTKLFAWDGVPKERVALTVTQIDIRTEYIRKGIDLFIQLCGALPDVEFRIVGIRGQALECARADGSAYANLSIIPAPVATDALRQHYHDAACYCQLSIDETFGVAVLEGMTAGAIPIVSEAPALREVVGDVGSVVSRENPIAIADAVQSAMTASDAERQTAIDRAQIFAFDIRASKLLSELAH